MAKGLDDNVLILTCYDWLEQGIKAGFDIDDVLSEIIDCAQTARDDYEQDHKD